MEKFLNLEGLEYVCGRLRSDLSGKQDVLKGQPGQVVGFDSTGAALARNGWGNPNLLDNWYFPSPINQRRQMEYRENGYTIDRWRLYGSGIRCVLNDNYLSIAATADNNSIGQTIESESILFEQVTFSCLRSDGTLVSGTGKIPSTATDYHSVTLYSDQTISLYIQYLSRKMLALIGVKNNNTVNAVAAKLELGPVQTLAHQEGDTWVLNDPPPNPALELAKCQRYYEVSPPEKPYSLEPNGIQTVQLVRKRAIPAITLTYNSNNKVSVDYVSTGSFRASSHDGASRSDYRWIADANL